MPASLCKFPIMSWVFAFSIPSLIPDLPIPPIFTISLDLSCPLDG